MFVILLFFMGIVFIETNGNTFKEGMFRKVIPRYTVYPGIVSSPGLVNTYTPSRVSCGKQCVAVDWCVSFAYNATMTMCSLYSEQIPTVTSTSTSFYSDRCPVSLGFKYETSLHFCYWISTYLDTWQNADSTCRNKGATLAKTNTTEILNFLFQFTNGRSAWVGANDIATEWTFVWADGGSLPINDGIWDYGQPNGGWIDEDCCIIFLFGPRLQDAPCYFPFIFVCEYNL